MKVYYGNFGEGNYAWQECLERHSIAVMDDLRVYPYWKNHDLDGYRAEAMRVLMGRNGNPATLGTATYWYNLNTLLDETVGDLWFHQDGERIWWTISSDEKQTEEARPNPNRALADFPINISFKRCLPWSCHDKDGTLLSWEGTHAKARNIFSRPGTFSKIKNDYETYALAMLEGKDLSAWHHRPDWIAADPQYQRRARHKPSTEEIARFRIQQAAERMVQTAWDTAQQSGRKTASEAKVKRFAFPSKEEASKYVSALLQQQGDRCALTGIKMLQEDDLSDLQRHYSLDRIDSNGHYEMNNLQVVCKFANRWKSASADKEFKRLIALVRNSA